jgi:hypothetical protein
LRSIISIDDSYSITRSCESADLDAADFDTVFDAAGARSADFNFAASASSEADFDAADASGSDTAGIGATGFD